MAGRVHHKGRKGEDPGCIANCSFHRQFTGGGGPCVGCRCTASQFTANCLSCKPIGGHHFSRVALRFCRGRWGGRGSGRFFRDRRPLFFELQPSQFLSHSNFLTLFNFIFLFFTSFVYVSLHEYWCYFFVA